jgi:hypothetical protein
MGGHANVTLSTPKKNSKASSTADQDAQFEKTIKHVEAALKCAEENNKRRQAETNKQVSSVRLKLKPKHKRKPLERNKRNEFLSLLLMTAYLWVV